MCIFFFISVGDVGFSLLLYSVPPLPHGLLGGRLNRRADLYTLFPHAYAVCWCTLNFLLMELWVVRCRK